MPAHLAVIDENSCIGCTKCIQACPFDAILGAPQQMHTVLNTECTGCKLCIAPCPVDCISLIEIEKPLFDIERVKQRRRAKRLRDENREISDALPPATTQEAKQLIQDALSRVKQKRHDTR